MSNQIRNTNLRFNLEKDLQRKAWEYLQSMNRQEFKSYSHVISLALVDYFDRYYRIAEELNTPSDLPHKRIYDRILERCVPVRINNRNIRQENASANLQEAKKILL